MLLEKSTCTILGGGMLFPWRSQDLSTGRNVSIEYAQCPTAINVVASSVIIFGYLGFPCASLRM